MKPAWIAHRLNRQWVWVVCSRCLTCWQWLCCDTQTTFLGELNGERRKLGRKRGPGRKAGRGLVVVGRESGTRVVLLLRAQSRPLPLFSSPLPCQMPKEIWKLEHKSCRTYRTKFRKKNKEIFHNERWCQINCFYSNINHSPTNCHAVANPIPCFQGCKNNVQVVWKFSVFFYSFGISTLFSWDLRNITPRTTVLSLAGENALISSITVMSSPSKATTRCQPVLLLPLFNIHRRLGWNQRWSDFDNHHLWLLQPKALAFKSRQWLTQAIHLPKPGKNQLKIPSRDRGCKSFSEK